MQEAFPILLVIALWLTAAAGWITNVIWTFQQDSVLNVALGILGAFIAPIGAIHGIYTWF